MKAPEQRAKRILIVDDNPDDRTLVAREVCRAFPWLETIEAGGREEFERALESAEFDLVITDYQLRWSDGLKVLRAVKEMSPDCPVIMFTGTGTQEIAVEAMKQGLDDYLIKSPAHYVRLPPSVGAAFQRQEVRQAKRRAEEGLRCALAEKELLLKELYHRVKNNMQIISSLLDLQAATIHEEAMQEMFRATQSRIRAMALVHEKLYPAKDLTRINFSQYVQDLASDLFSSYGIDTRRVRLKIDLGADEAIAVDVAVPCGLVINELVSNSLKYAFPEGRKGEVRIALRDTRDGRCTLMVGDNGIGLPADFEQRTRNSLGMSLVNSLVRDQLGGRMERSLGEGTEFRITFPERERKAQ